MRVLLVGLGRMGQRYIRVLNEIFGSDLRIIAIDPLTPNISGIKVLPSWDSLGNENFDLAIDAHPNEGRLEVLKHFIDLGLKRVIIEKPLASSWKEALAVVSACDESNLKVLSPFYNRFSSHFIPDTFEKLDAGRLLTINISGGALGIGCNGIHYIDLFNYLFKQTPLTIYSSLDLNSVMSPRGAQFKDHGGLIVLNYPKGRATLELCSQSSVGICMHLVFEYGRIVINDQLNPEWFWFNQPHELRDQPKYRTSNEKTVQPPFSYEINIESMMKIALGKFIQDESVPGIREGINALKTLGYAISSSTLKRLVSWDEENLLETAAFTFT